MTAEISITLPAPPSANDYWKPARGRGLVPSDEGLAFKGQVADLFTVNGWLPVVGRVHFAVVTHFTRQRDIGANALKVLEDALNERGWLDDNQMDDVHVHRGELTDPPTVEIRITGERFASEVEAREYRDAKADTRRRRRRTRAVNKAAREAGLLERAQARAAPIRGSTVLPFRRKPPPMEVHMSDCLSLYGKGASCTCGAVKR